ncbi:MAG: site-2 protease family protein [Ktedonobacteraceae bacterium]|nr:site-2 protease family protein [Ktedonobacteraceae bacterium]
MNNWYLLAAIPVFGLLVFVHELGHFIAAKWAGIRVEEFGLGFPPALVGFRRRHNGGWDVLWFGRGRNADTGDAKMQTPFATSGGTSNASTPSTHHTIYSLNLLPIGGFVRMPGENGDVLDEHGKYDTGSFAAKSAGKRMIVLVAGVLMNFLLSIVLFTFAYSAGEPTFPSTIGTVEPGSPAAVAGLKPDDRILTVNGQKVETFDDLVNQVNQVIADQSKGTQLQTVPVSLQVQRAGVKDSFPLTVNARVNPPAGKGHMGVTQSQKPVFVTSPVWQAPFKGIAHTFDVTRQFIVSIGQMITGAVQPRLAGPVGIVQITGEVAQRTGDLGWWPILSLTAILSLNLAIVNILPFPALDGGRIVLVMIEVLRGGKRLRPEREGLINLVGMAILLTLMAVITVSDIMHWGS